MPDGDNGEQLVKLLALGGAGFVAWKFAYQPWAMQQRLNAEVAAQTAANVQKGMSWEDASTAAVSGACKLVGAIYKVPPSSSGGLCNAIGGIATWTTKESLKATIAVAKLVGKGAQKVGHGVAVAGKDVGKGVKFVSYTAPKAVVIGVGKGVAKGAQKVGHAIAHGFGLWGLEEATPRRPRRAGAVFPANIIRRQALPQLAAQRSRRGLAGLPTGRPRRAAGVEYYARHLRPR